MNRNCLRKGRSLIYNNENVTDIIFYIVYEKETFEIINVSTKEHFIANPLTYADSKVFWNVENTFIGDKNNEFLLLITSEENNFSSKLYNKNCVISNLHDGICEITIKIMDNNLFSRKEEYLLSYEGELIIGSSDKFRFLRKRIKLLSASCFNKIELEWVQFIPKYFIDRLTFIEDSELTYYTGRLCVIDSNGITRELNTMINEKGKFDKINPVRIELRDSNTLWLVAGWEGHNDFLGNLFYDNYRAAICNIQKQDNNFDEIILYKFKEEDECLIRQKQQKKSKKST